MKKNEIFVDLSELFNLPTRSRQDYNYADKSILARESTLEPMLPIHCREDDLGAAR